MKRTAFLATVLVAGLSMGCVERTFVITSDPPGALVYRNGVPIGTTPCDDHFVYYGKYQFTLVRDKCQTLQVVEDVQPPWYEYPGVDFFSENLFPCKLNDVRRLHYVLPCLQTDSQEQVLQRSKELRERGKQIGAPRPVAPPPPQMPPPPLPGPPPITAPNPVPGLPTSRQSLPVGSETPPR